MCIQGLLLNIVCFRISWNDERIWYHFQYYHHSRDDNIHARPSSGSSSFSTDERAFRSKTSLSNIAISLFHSYYPCLSGEEFRNNSRRSFLLVL